MPTSEVPSTHDIIKFFQFHPHLFLHRFHPRLRPPLTRRKEKNASATPIFTGCPPNLVYPTHYYPSFYIRKYIFTPLLPHLPVPSFNFDSPFANFRRAKGSFQPCLCSFILKKNNKKNVLIKINRVTLIVSEP